MLKISRQSLSSNRRLKILVLGCCSSGKSALVERIIAGKYTENDHKQTVGAELFLKEETFKNERTTIELWDCGGHERFRPIIQQLYAHVKGVILVYDMTNDASFQELVYWRNEIIRNCSEAVCIIVGNKSDRSDNIRITAEDGIKQSREWGMNHIMISAKLGTNIETILPTLLSSKKPNT